MPHCFLCGVFIERSESTMVPLGGTISQSQASFRSPFHVNTMSSRRRVKALVGILFRMLLRADGTSEIRTADPETLYHLGHWSEDLVQRGVWKPLPPEGPPFPSYRGHPQGVFTGPWVLGRVLIHSNQPRIRCDYRTPPHVPAIRSLSYVKICQTIRELETLF